MAPHPTGRGRGDGGNSGLWLHTRLEGKEGTEAAQECGPTLDWKGEGGRRQLRTWPTLDWKRGRDGRSSGLWPHTRLEGRVCSGDGRSSGLWPHTRLEGREGTDAAQDCGPTLDWKEGRDGGSSGLWPHTRLEGEARGRARSGPLVHTQDPVATHQTETGARHGGMGGGWRRLTTR